MFHNISFDQAHVMLDAIAALEKSIAAGVRPWDQYDDDGSGDDVKVTEAGYRALLDGCKAVCGDTLDKG